MFSLAAKSLVRPASRLLPVARAPRRAQSSAPAPAPARGGLLSHALAGIAGGGAVLIVGYAVYYFSSVRPAVETAQRVLAAVQLPPASPRTASAAQPSDAARDARFLLAHLRAAAKAYAAALPGSGFVLDRTFDHADAVVDAHADEALALLRRAQADIADVVAQRGARSDTELAAAVMGVLWRRVSEVQALGVKAGETALRPVIDWLPGAAVSVAGGLQVMGDGAHKIGTNAMDKVKGKLFKDGDDPQSQDTKEKGS